MDRPIEQPNQIARSFAFFFYAFCIFVGIRIWIEVVASGDRSAEITAAVITFVILCCIWSRYRRHRRWLELQARRRAAGTLDVYELFNRHRALLEAEGFNANGGLNLDAIGKLPNVIYKETGLELLNPPVATVEPAGSPSEVNKLEEGTLACESIEAAPSTTVPTVASDNSSSSSSGSPHAYASLTAEALHAHHNDINSCPICLNDFMIDEILLLLPKCGHAYHRACITEWLLMHNSCPLCKHEVIEMPRLEPLNLPEGAAVNHAAPLVRPILMTGDGFVILRIDRSGDNTRPEVTPSVINPSAGVPSSASDPNAAAIAAIAAPPQPESSPPTNPSVDNV